MVVQLAFLDPVPPWLLLGNEVTITLGAVKDAISGAYNTVMLVVGDEQSTQANYHGTTIFAQAMRGMRRGNAALRRRRNPIWRSNALP